VDVSISNNFKFVYGNKTALKESELSVRKITFRKLEITEKLKLTYCLLEGLSGKNDMVRNSMKQLYSSGDALTETLMHEHLQTFMRLLY
jgi:hypothetical protein